MSAFGVLIQNNQQDDLARPQQTTNQRISRKPGEHNIMGHFIIDTQGKFPYTRFLAKRLLILFLILLWLVEYKFFGNI